MKNEAERKYESHLEYETETMEQPSLYQVILHGDDFTPIEFMMMILEKYFYMGRREAAEKTFEAHAKGRTVGGTFSKDFAESKMVQVMEYAALHDFPLHCSMEVA